MKSEYQISADTEIGKNGARVFLTPEDNYFALSFSGEGMEFRITGWDIEQLENLVDMIQATLVEAKVQNHGGE